MESIFPTDFLQIFETGHFFHNEHLRNGIEQVHYSMLEKIVALCDVIVFKAGMASRLQVAMDYKSIPIVSCRHDLSHTKPGL